MSSEEQQNSMFVPGFTAEASLHDAIEEYREVTRTYMTKESEQVIRPSMTPRECGNACKDCHDVNQDCCVRLSSDGTCHAGCCRWV